MKYEIKKLDMWTTARFVGLFYGLIGLVPMVIGFFAFLGRSYNRGFDAEIFAFLFFPLGAFVAGFVAGLVFSLIYNWLAGSSMGGIKLEIDYNHEPINNKQ